MKNDIYGPYVAQSDVDIGFGTATPNPPGRLSDFHSPPQEAVAGDGSSLHTCHVLRVACVEQSAKDNLARCFTVVCGNVIVFGCTPSHQLQLMNMYRMRQHSVQRDSGGPLLCLSTEVFDWQIMLSIALNFRHLRCTNTISVFATDFWIR